MTEPSVNDEKLSDHDPRNMFASDGRKLEEAEFVGSHSPDSDADPDAEADAEKQPRH